MSSTAQKTLLVGLGVTAGISAISYAISKYKRKEVTPKHWKKIGTLKELYFYPIKSCAGISLDASLCENLGVREGDVKDRALMLVDEGKQLVSARTYPKMFQIIPKIVGRSKLIISAPGMEDLDFDYMAVGSVSNEDMQAIMHGNYVTVMDCGDKYHKWFSQFLLGKPDGLRLVYYPYPVPTKAIDKDFRNGVCTKQDTGTLQDVTSYMLINNRSVEELNSRLMDKVVPLQFRAVFYVDATGPPFDEDNWQWVRVGEDAIFRNVGPCYRCIMPNINPFSAERSSDGEPLKTLNTYRVIPGAKTKSPGMGIQMGLRVPGSVKKGDSVYVPDLSSE